MILLALIGLLAGPAEGLAGSRACAACHAAIYRSYTATPMARSSGRVGTGASLERFERAEFTHARSGARYRVVQEQGGMAFEFERPASGSIPEIRGRRRLDYYIGSGAVGRSYAYLAARFLFQAPVSYYTAAARWDISPGFGGHNRIYLGRPIDPDCLSCHATGARAADGTQNRYDGEPFEEAGIGCERCHGAGERHIAAIAKGSSGAAAIVNPKRLDAERRDSICAQCHLTGEARVARRDRTFQSFRPGDRLRDHVVSFVRPEARELRLRVTSHFEKLWQSRCKKASGDRFWCGTCHDPHAQPAAGERETYYRGKCLGCHEATACRGDAAERAASRDACAACHMPAGAVADVGHAVYTDHSIPRRRVASVLAEPEAATLVPFWGGTPDPRDLGVAYGDSAAASSGGRADPRFHLAFERLEPLGAALASDPTALEQLGYLYDRRGDAEKSAFYYEWALLADPTRIVSAVNLGAARAQKRGGLQYAMSLWLQALGRNPGLEVPRIYLGQIYRRFGMTAQAREVVQKGLEFYPDSPALRELASRLEQK